MPQDKLSMRKIRDVLRYRFDAQLIILASLRWCLQVADQAQVRVMATQMALMQRLQLIVQTEG
jgi:hypothetical protein